MSWLTIDSINILLNHPNKYLMNFLQYCLSNIQCIICNKFGLEIKRTYSTKRSVVHKSFNSLIIIDVLNNLDSQGIKPKTIIEIGNPHLSTYLEGSSFADVLTLKTNYDNLDKKDFDTINNANQPFYIGINGQFNIIDVLRKIESSLLKTKLLIITSSVYIINDKFDSICEIEKFLISYKLIFYEFVGGNSIQYWNSDSNYNGLDLIFIRKK